MPQIYNLGGFTLQKTHTIRLSALRSQDLQTPYLEVNFANNSIYLFNVEKITTKKADGTAGPTITAQQIELSPTNISP